MKEKYPEAMRRSNLATLLVRRWVETQRPEIWEKIWEEVDKQIPRKKLKPPLHELPKSLLVK